MDLVGKNSKEKVALDRIEDIKSRLELFNKANKAKLRIRDLADELNVSEAELLSLEVGGSVKYLKINSFHDFIKNLNKIDRLMFLTRNDNVVHEKILLGEDIYVAFDKFMTINYLDKPVIFLNNIFFTHLFSQTKIINGKEINSFQFFNNHGDAVLKIYIKEDKLSIFNKLVNEYQVYYKYELQLDSIESLLDNNSSEIDLFTHIMSTKFLSCATFDRKYVKKESFLREIFNLFSKNKINIGIYVNGLNSIQFHNGIIERIVDYKGWLNILDSEFNLHIKEKEFSDVICIYFSKNNDRFHLHFFDLNEKCCLGIYNNEINKSFSKVVKLLIA